jgi:hypothetical protein
VDRYLLHEHEKIVLQEIKKEVMASIEGNEIMGSGKQREGLT